MTRLWVIVIFLATHLLQGCESLQWTQKVEDGEQFTRCTGQDVTFPWRYSLEEGDDVAGVSWSRQRQGGKEVNLASLFFLKFTPNQERISHVNESGIKVTSLTTDDTASYSISVRLGGGGGVERQTIHLLVAEKPETVSGSLEVVVAETRSNKSHDHGSTDQHQQLKCGQFVSLGSPPVSVMWEDPDGKLLPSSDYQDGFFILNLTEGRKGGNYYCLMNLSSTAVGCLSETSALRDKAMVGVLKSQTSTSSASMGGGTVAGIIIAVLIIVALVVVAVVFFLKFKRGKSYSPKEPESPGPDKETEEMLKALPSSV
ncbi:uncharacterized protein [Littorina saxatilis]|uniref:Ig-like domain-containing protein n=1 Tax=Littorina saxatilis TaxID=31220 RepID=A0AAN9GH10_9CAEN